MKTIKLRYKKIYILQKYVTKEKNILQKNYVTKKYVTKKLLQIEIMLQKKSCYKLCFL